MTNKEIIVNYSLDQILSLMYEAKFPKQDSEAVYVGTVIFNYRKVVDILPDITNPKQNEETLTQKYLLAIGFFREKLQHRNKYHGGPSLDYFMNTTRERLARIGQKDVAENTENWADYLHDNFQAKPEQTKEVVPITTYKKPLFHESFPKSLAWKRLGPIANNYSLGDLKNSSDSELPPLN